MTLELTTNRWGEKHPRIERAPPITAEGRLCRACGERKPDSEFGRSVKSPSRTVWRCKACARKAHKAWRTANTEHVRDTARGTARRMRERDPVAARAALKRSRLKKKYGLTVEQVEAMMAAQNSLCGICGAGLRWTSDKTDVGMIQIDHCHDTGRIRGLLCIRCNSALGKFGDDIGMLKAAIAYLERS